MATNGLPCSPLWVMQLFCHLNYTSLSAAKRGSGSRLYSTTRGNHCCIPCTSTCDGDFTEILIPYATCVRKGGVTTLVRLLQEINGSRR